MVEWTVVSVFAVACSVGGVRWWCQELFVVSVDDRFYVGHTTVAYFNVVLVKYFMELMLSREVSLYQVEKESSDVGGDVVVVRGVEPDDVSFAVFWLLVLCCRCVLELVIVSRPLECCRVVWRCLAEDLFV